MLISWKLTIFSTDMLWESCREWKNGQLSQSIAVPKMHSLRDISQLTFYILDCIKSSLIWVKVQKKWYKD